MNKIYKLVYWKGEEICKILRSLDEVRVILETLPYVKSLRKIGIKSKYIWEHVNLTAVKITEISFKGEFKEFKEESIDIQSLEDHLSVAQEVCGKDRDYYGAYGKSLRDWSIRNDLYDIMYVDTSENEFEYGFYFSEV